MSSKKRALLVEDDIEIVELIERFLVFGGFDVVTAGSIEEARTLLLESDRFDILISDFYLKDSTADSLLDFAKKRNPDIPVLLTSGGNNETPIESVHAVGAVSGAISFLQKPFLRSELLAAVNEAVGSRNF